MKNKILVTPLQYLLISAIIIILGKLFLFDLIIVEGDSMKPTLYNRSITFYSKINYGLLNPFSGKYFVEWSHPKKGDIVIFWYQRGNKYLIKRCIAIAGDTIVMEKRKLQIPEGFIFVIGDNEEVSLDSRQIGFIPVDTVIGKVMRVGGSGS